MSKIYQCRKMRQVPPSGVARNDGMLSLLYWFSYLERPILAELAVEEASLHTTPSHSTMSVYAVYRRNNKLLIVLALVLALAALASLLVMGLHMPFGSALPFGFTSCLWADRMSPRSTEMEMGLYFYQEWYMTDKHGIESLLESMGFKTSCLIAFTSLGIIFTVPCLDFTLYCLHKHEWAAFIIASSKGNENHHVTPALDEFYRFHSVIGEQIGQSIPTLDSVLIFSDVRVTDERSLLLPSRSSHFEGYECIADQFQ
ncbi:hypothetical protein BU17DRAFT_63817 [Hysterangium stoloniferum]|nr:hypothetical protein BU17DRAFT_63817 [Hysterangium stoloniferum]